MQSFHRRIKNCWPGLMSISSIIQAFKLRTSRDRSVTVLCLSVWLRASRPPTVAWTTKTSCLSALSTMRLSNSVAPLSKGMRTLISFSPYLIISIRRKFRSSPLFFSLTSSPLLLDWLSPPSSQVGRLFSQWLDFRRSPQNSSWVFIISIEFEAFLHFC